MRLHGLQPARVPIPSFGAVVFGVILRPRLQHEGGRACATACRASRRACRRSPPASRLVTGCLLGASALAALAGSPLCRRGAPAPGPALARGEPVITRTFARASRAAVAVRPRLGESRRAGLARYRRPRCWTRWVVSRDLRAGEGALRRRTPQRAALAPNEVAWLHQWVGEVELARDQQPEAAIWHFRHGTTALEGCARQRTEKAGGRGGLAEYDTSLARFYGGVYAEAVGAFRHLLATAPSGLDRRQCALWYRQAAACPGYHAEHADRVGARVVGDGAGGSGGIAKRRVPRRAK